MNDNQPFLEQLYKEYQQLETRKAKVANLIVEYGGSIPTPIVTAPPTTTVPATTTIPPNQFHFSIYYPLAGTWKDKIRYILLRFDGPATVQEIVDKLIQYESDTDREKLHTTVTQYCSNMGKEGELIVESGYRNKYFVKNG